MLISQAFAQAVDGTVTTATATPGLFNMIVQFALIVFILYFLLIRPQQKKIKQHEAELNAIVKGSKIVIGGIEGVVCDVLSDNKLRVKIADNAEITVLRGYVSHVITDDKK